MKQSKHIQLFARVEVDGVPLPERPLGWLHVTKDEFPVRMAELFREAADYIEGLGDTDGDLG